MKTKIGKKIGNITYAHWKYAEQVLPPDVMWAVKAAELSQATYIKHDRKTGNVTLGFCPRWDQEDEPVIAKTLSFTQTTPDGHYRHYDLSNPLIIHGKSLFVGSDYRGFDVSKARARFQKQQEVLTPYDKSRIGRLKYWNLVKHLIEED